MSWIYRIGGQRVSNGAREDAGEQPEGKLIVGLDQQLRDKLLHWGHSSSW